MINELLKVELEEVKLDEKLNKDLTDEIEEIYTISRIQFFAEL